MADEIKYQELLDFALGLADKAVVLIKKGSAARWKQSADVEAKKNSVDLVTVTDQAVEEMIKSSIKAKYPLHKFIGEESWEAGERDPLTDEYTWIVDPIDGTMNFVHSNPFVGCSIGVAHNSQPIVGVIAQPFLNRTISARLGGGAFMNRTIKLPLTGGIPQPLTKLSQCLIGAEWGSDRSMKTFEKKAKSFTRLAGDPTKGVEGGVMVHALRTTGSTTCNLVSVATGEYDMYWDAGCYAWDVCAGAAILHEVGGFFSGGKDAFANDSPIGEIIMNRRYVAVRAVPPTADETSEAIQRRLVAELYNVVEEWTNADM